MATKVNLIYEKNNIPKTGVVGFSFTTFFFGFFVPLFRGDLKWCFIMIFSHLAIAFPTAGIGNIVLEIVYPCIYNSIYTKNLLKEGYMPADDFSENLLAARGYIVRQKTSPQQKAQENQNQQEQLELTDNAAVKETFQENTTKETIQEEK